MLESTEFAKESLRILSAWANSHRAMEPSIEDVLGYLKGRRFDGYVFADLIRYHTCSRLDEARLPKGVTFDRLSNNGILLRCEGTPARVWKADEDGELQGPGNSKSKQAYFDQDSLFWDDPRFIGSPYSAV